MCLFTCMHACECAYMASVTIWERDDSMPLVVITSALLCLHIGISFYFWNGKFSQGASNFIKSHVFILAREQENQIMNLTICLDKSHQSKT